MLYEIVKKGFKIIIVGGALIVLGIIIFELALSQLYSVALDENSPFSLFDQANMTAEEWSEKGVQEYWNYLMTILLGYLLSGAGVVIGIIGGVVVLREWKTSKT